MRSRRLPGLLACMVLLCAAAANALASDWQTLLDEAGWIVRVKDETARSGPKYYFARDIDIGQAAVKSAVLKITAESVCSVAINGKDVGTSDHWYDLVEYDIKPFLQPGKNRIVATVIKKEWILALFAAARIQFEDGSELDLISDTSWDTWWEGDKTVRKAEVHVKGVDGGLWNNVTPLDMPPQATELNTGLVLPHIAWAKPYAGRGLKVLAIQSRWKQTNTVGLYHRLDCDVKAIFSDPMREDRRPPFFRPFKGALKKDIIADLAEATRHSYDVIIMAGISEELFGTEAQEWLKEQVRAGAALIIAAGLPGKGMTEEMTRTPVTAIPAFLTVGLPYEKLPGLSPRPETHFPASVSLYEYGKGRVVKLGFNMAPVSRDDETRYEYYQSFLIKCILWATGQEPDVAFTKFPVTLEAETPGGEMPELAFQIDAPEVPGTYEVALGICSEDQYLDLPSVPYARPGVHQGAKVVLPVRSERKSIEIKGATPVEFALPQLPAGEYFVNVRVSKGGVNVNWASASLSVQPKLTVRQVTTDPAWLDLRADKVQPIRATVVLSGPAPEGASLDVSVIDNYDRLLDRKVVKLAADQESAEIGLSVPHMLTILGKVRAELTVGGDRVDVGVGRFTAVRRDWDRFTFAGWTSGDKATERLLAGLGRDGHRGSRASDVADWVSIRFAGGERIGRVDTDPAVLAKIKKGVQKNARDTLPWDPLCYVSGDEVRYGGGEELPARVADFRRQLQKEYGTVEALNKEWDADYASFDEIPAITGEAATAFQAKAAQTRNFSPMVDQQLENFRAYANNWKFYQDAISEADPGARMGTESPLWPWAGSCFDWYAILQNINMFSPYGRDGDIQTYEYGSSFGRPGMLLAMTYGGYLYNGFIRRAEPNDPEFLRWRPWNGLLRGYNCVWWYRFGNVESGLGPGGEPYPAFLALARAVARIRTGYYTLLRGTKRQNDGIAIHYSVPSNIVGQHIRDFNVLPWDVHTLIRILQDHAPRRYEFVATQQIANGELDKYKVLILPLSRAITKEESAAFEAFVRRGGILIADARPGLTDGHGKFGNNEVIPKLFGITYDRSLGRKLVTAELHGEYRGVAFHAESGRFPADPAVRLDGAKAALKVDGVPLLTYNDVGKGTAICINSPFNWFLHLPGPDSLYFYLGDKGHNIRMGNILKAIFKAHNIRRTASVEPAKGEWPWGLEIRYNTDGPAQYVGLTKRRGAKVEPDRELEVTVPRKGHLYDMFSGRYYGRKSSWKVTMPASDVRLFSLLPYKVKGLKVLVSQDAVTPGSMIEGRVEVEKARGEFVRHVINVQVIRPDGKAIRYLARNLETEGGAATFSLPLALNEPEGAYTLTFTDVASQKKTKAKLDVRLK